MLATLLCGISAQAEIRLATPNWDRELALQTAERYADDHLLHQWFNDARAGNAAKLLEEVQAYSTSSRVSAPARERQLYLFTLGLSDLPTPAIPLQLVDMLEAYAPQTLVPDEENSYSAVPLFNIPAAARGLRHTLERRRAAAQSARLVVSDPDAWIRAYLTASPSRRRGFLDAIDAATDRQRENLMQNALQGLADQPALSPVAARIATARKDVRAIQYLMIHAHGPGLADMLRSAAATLSPRDQAIALLDAISAAPVDNAALAIALLAPGVIEMPEISDSLFDLLEDRSLGSAAALVLSRHPDPAVQARLRKIAHGHDLAGRRAQLSLELVDSGSNP